MSLHLDGRSLSWLELGLSSLALCFTTLSVLLIARTLKRSAMLQRTSGMNATSSEFQSTPMLSSKSRQTKRTGATRVASTILIAVCCFSLLTVPATIALARYFDRWPMYTLRGVQVVSKEQSSLPGYTYWMVYDSNSVGPLKFIARFCPDYEPPFDTGDYLLLLRYEDHRNCWSLKDDHAGVQIRRDTHGRTDSEIAHERTR